MFSSRCHLLFQPVSACRRLAVAWPKTGIAIGMAFIGLGVWGVYGWARDPLADANRALKLDRLDQALEHAQQCLDKWPGMTKAHLLAAHIQRLRTNFPEVEKHLKECKRLEGMTERIQLEWMLLRCQAGELASVERTLVDCVQQKHPQSALILECLAFALMKEMRYRDALGCLDEWHEQEPDNVRALDWRGWIRARLEFKEGAYEDCQKALELAPDHWRTRLRLAEMLLTDVNTPEAAKHFDILMVDHGDNFDVVLALAWCRSLQGRTDEAERLLHGLLKKEPKNATAIFYMSKLAASPVEKELWCRKVLAVERGHLEARYALSTSLQQQGRTEEAAAELAKYKEMRSDVERLHRILMPLLNKTPNNAELLVQIGEILLNTQESQGERFLQKALNADPQHAQAHEILARFYESKNELRKAKHHREMAEASRASGR
ncbi:MAG TPA: tetratricopeptide repeat protein [Gemmataceae bacterium]|nr:tetratricopeptide repeat protein [Gemmataceae bacterium]